MRPVAARLLRRKGAPPSAKVAPGDITKALVIAVSFIHLAIQVRWHLQARPAGGRTPLAALARPTRRSAPRAPGANARRGLAVVPGSCPSGPATSQAVTRCSRCTHTWPATLRLVPKLAAQLAHPFTLPSHPRRPRPRRPRPRPARAPKIPVGLSVLLDPRLAADPVYGVSWLSQAMVTVSSGYFTYDLASVALRYDLEGPQFLVHALCCLFVYGYAVFFGTLHWFGELAGGAGRGAGARGRGWPTRRGRGRHAVCAPSRCSTAVFRLPAYHPGVSVAAIATSCLHGSA